MLHPESELLPFTISPLPAGPWLVFAPHADDETFGMGGTLLKAREEGLDTHVVVVTDGALGGDADDLVDTRRQEIQKAGDLLGLSSLTFWDVPDREVAITNEQVEAALADIERLQARTVFFPAPLEIHPDHRATGHLVWQAIQMATDKGMEIDTIAYEIGVQNPINMCIDITAQEAAKAEVMDVYASQNSENNYPELVRALDKGRTFSLPPDVKFAEGFYRFSEQEKALVLPEVVNAIIARYLPLENNSVCRARRTT